MNEQTEGQQIAPEIQAMLEAADAEAAEFEAMGSQPVPQVPDCIICGASPATSRTGRCDSCKGKRLSNNRVKIEAAKGRLGISVAEAFGQGKESRTTSGKLADLSEITEALLSESEQEQSTSATIAALEQEILQLRHLLAARQPISLADFRERVAICHEAGVEHYEDGAIKLIFNNELRKALVRPMETVPASERVF